MMSNHVIISSAKPCKQSEIIITFASTNHVLSNQFLSFGFAIQRLLSCKEPHFSQINYDVDLATAQSKIKTSIFSPPQPPLPPAVLKEIVTDVWGLMVVTCEGLLPTIITKGMCVQNKKSTNISIRKNKPLQWYDLCVPLDLASDWKLNIQSLVSVHCWCGCLI